jgi:hypothetical protein
MEIRINAYTLIGCIIIVALTVDSWSKVGKPMKACGEVFDPWLPFAVLGLFSMIFLLGYLGGKDD